MLEVEKYEDAVSKASYMVFSEYFEILFRMSQLHNTDPYKSDMLKFKQFLQFEIFNNLKFHLRLKHGEEFTKPHKVRIFKLLSKMYKAN